MDNDTRRGSNPMGDNYGVTWKIREDIFEAVNQGLKLLSLIVRKLAWQ